MLFVFFIPLVDVAASFKSLDVLETTKKLIGTSSISISMFLGHFARFKLKISRKRLRSSLDIKVHRNLPPRCKPFRRTYSVKGALSVLHVDGYHHFIR